MGLVAQPNWAGRDKGPIVRQVTKNSMVIVNEIQSSYLKWILQKNSHQFSTSAIKIVESKGVKITKLGQSVWRNPGQALSPSDIITTVKISGGSTMLPLLSPLSLVFHLSTSSCFLSWVKKTTDMAIMADVLSLLSCLIQTTKTQRDGWPLCACYKAENPRPSISVRNKNSFVDLIFKKATT